MFTTEEIRKCFSDATTGKYACKGRKVTFEMMERDAVTETIEKVREGLPAKRTKTHILIKRSHAVSK